MLNNSSFFACQLLLLNSITTGGSTSVFRQPDGLPLEQTLQEMIDTIGQVLEVDICILRGFDGGELGNFCFFWHKSDAFVVPDTLLAQTVWKTDRVIILSHVDPKIVLLAQKTDNNWQGVDIYQQAEICSSLLIPLLLKQKIVAVLALHQCQSPRHWQDKEIRLAMMIADQAVLILSQHRAYEQVRAFAQREVLINTITVAIRSSLDPQTIYTAITHQLGQALAADGCALSLWTKEDLFVQCVGLYDRYELEQSELKTVEQLGISVSNRPLPQSVVPIADNPVLQQLLKTRQPVVLEDLEADRDLKNYDLPLRSPARALLIVPLIVEGEIIGSISLRQTSQPRTWTDSEIDLANSVASQAAIATQQARLYETTKQQAELLRQSEQRVTQLNQYLTESVLKRFLPASIVNRVAAGDLALSLTPETRLVTVLFSDIVDFMPLSTQLGSSRVAVLLNEYLEMMTQAVFEHGGTVDKFIGDAVFALFGAPELLAAPEQVRRAIAVARTMHRYLKILNRRWQAEGLVGSKNKPPPLQFRCGIHQGEAVVGMFGGGQRSDYTAIGPAVNMAARLQQAAEANTIIVSQVVASYLEPREINEVKFLALKGIKNEVLAFSIHI